MVSVNKEQARTPKAGEAGRTANVVVLVQCKTCRKSTSKRIKKFLVADFKQIRTSKLHFAYAKAGPSRVLNESR